MSNIFIFDFDLTLTTKHSSGHPNSETDYFNEEQKTIIINMINFITNNNKDNKIFILSRGDKNLIKNNIISKFKELYDNISVIPYNKNLEKMCIKEDKKPEMLKGIFGSDKTNEYKINGIIKDNSNGNVNWAYIKSIMISKIKNVYPDDKIYFFDDTQINIQIFDSYIKTTNDYSFHVKLSKNILNDVVNLFFMYDIKNINNYSKKNYFDFNIYFYDKKTNIWYMNNYLNSKKYNEFIAIEDKSDKYKNSVSNAIKDKTINYRFIIYSKRLSKWYINKIDQLNEFYEFNKDAYKDTKTNYKTNYESKYLKYKNKYLIEKKKINN
jgi:hypothetical protein